MCGSWPVPRFKPRLRLLPMRGRRGLAAWALTTSAVLLSALLVVAAFVVPLYGGGEPDTLVGVNGLGVLLPVGTPLVLSVIGWLGLRRDCTVGSRTGRGVARSAVWLLGFLSVLGSMTIGMFVAPIALLLGFGVAATPRA